MMLRLGFLCVSLLFAFQSTVRSLRIMSSPYLNPNVGDEFRFYCSDYINLFNDIEIMALEKERSPGVWQDLVKYTLNNGSTRYERTWGNASGNWQYRANIETTLSINHTNFGSIKLRLPDLGCNDSAAIRCRVQQSNYPETISQVRRISLGGVTTEPEISGGIECSSYEADPVTCNNCNSNATSSLRLYAPVNQAMMLTCSSQIALPSDGYVFNWYKVVNSDLKPQPIYQNISPHIGDVDGCTVDVFSEIRFYPRGEHKELQIFCEVTNQEITLMSGNVSVCVEDVTPYYLSTGSNAYQSLSFLMSMLLVFSCYIGLRD